MRIGLKAAKQSRKTKEWANQTRDRTRSAFTAPSVVHPAARKPLSRSRHQRHHEMEQDIRKAVRNHGSFQPSRNVEAPEDNSSHAVEAQRHGNDCGRQWPHSGHHGEVTSTEHEGSNHIGGEKNRLPNETVRRAPLQTQEPSQQGHQEKTQKDLLVDSAVERGQKSFPWGDGYSVRREKPRISPALPARSECQSETKETCAAGGYPSVVRSWTAQAHQEPLHSCPKV